MYIIGVLAIEISTKQQVIRGTAAHGDPNPNWINVIYPILFNILKEERFKKYMKCLLLNVGVRSETIRNVRNFITVCISLNPENRPTVETSLKSRLFGGSEEFEKKGKNDAWKKRTSPKKLNFLISLFIGRAAALKLPSDLFEEKIEDKYVTLVCELPKAFGNNQEPKPNENLVDDDNEVKPKVVQREDPGANEREDEDNEEVSHDEKIDINRERDFTEVNERKEVQSEAEVVLIRKQKIADWTKSARSRIVKSFSRLFSICRKSRK